MANMPTNYSPYIYNMLSCGKYSRRFSVGPTVIQWLKAKVDIELIFFLHRVIDFEQDICYEHFYCLKYAHNNIV